MKPYDTDDFDFGDGLKIHFLRPMSLQAIFNTYKICYFPKPT